MPRGKNRQRGELTKNQRKKANRRAAGAQPGSTAAISGSGPRPATMMTATVPTTTTPTTNTTAGSGHASIHRAPRVPRQSFDLSVVGDDLLQGLLTLLSDRSALATSPDGATSSAHRLAPLIITEEDELIEAFGPQPLLTRMARARKDALSRAEERAEGSKVEEAEDDGESDLPDPKSSPADRGDLADSPSRDEATRQAIRNLDLRQLAAQATDSCTGPKYDGGLIRDELIRRFGDGATLPPDGRRELRGVADKLLGGACDPAELRTTFGALADLVVVLRMLWGPEDSPTMKLMSGAAAAIAKNVAKNSAFDSQTATRVGDDFNGMRTMLTKFDSEDFATFRQQRDDFLTRPTSELANALGVRAAYFFGARDSTAENHNRFGVLALEARLQLVLEVADAKERAAAAARLQGEIWSWVQFLQLLGYSAGSPAHPALSSLADMASSLILATVRSDRARSGLNHVSATVPRGLATPAPAPATTGSGLATPASTPAPTGSRGGPGATSRGSGRGHGLRRGRRGRGRR